MSLWSKEQAAAYFESGGADEPPPPPPAPPPAAPLPKPSDDVFKKWFPKWTPRQGGGCPKFRIVCFHNAGSSENVYTGRGLRATVENPFVLHCRETGGELLACELPGREKRRAEPRETQLQPYCEQLYPVLAPFLQEADASAAAAAGGDAVPYVIVSHSMGTWFAYEFLKLLAERGIPFPSMWVVSGFPAPHIPERERPWNRNRPMEDDPDFFNECRQWNVNEIVFDKANWAAFGGMMRDDFTLFDEYTYTPPPAFLPGGQFPFPIEARFLTDDKRCREKHLALWGALTSAAFHLEECEGNHLFFYNNDHRAAWMRNVLGCLPPSFRS